MTDGNPGSSNITEFPARIDGGVCTSCQADLTYLIDALEGGRIEPGDVKVCPGCGHNIGRITKIVWRCSGCSTEIINPEKQPTHCTSCAGKLKYPDPDKVHKQ